MAEVFGKCTVQIVDLGSGIETHVKKMSCNLPGKKVLQAIENLLKGHLVSAKKAAAKPAISGKKPRSGQVKGSNSKKEANWPEAVEGDY